MEEWIKVMIKVTYAAGIISGGWDSPQWMRSTSNGTVAAPGGGTSSKVELIFPLG